MGWKPFSFDVVQLATLDDEVASGSGLVYSTNPRKAIGMDEETYFVKGPDREVVFAELAGCVLANAVGITVPSARVCIFADMLLAGTRQVSSIRAIEPWLRRPDKVRNYPEIFEAVIVDVWLGNTDRNMGNVIGDCAAGDEIEFVFIDFEKSVALRQYPNVNTAMIDSRRLWPSEDLGRMLMARKPLMPPFNAIARIRKLDEEACSALINPVSEALGGIEWAGDTAAALARRAGQIQSLAEEVWT